MGRLFGTDGVRGLTGTEITAELATGLGRAAVRVLGNGSSGTRPVFVIGRDTRVSGVWLEEAIAAGIREAGGDTTLVGVEPTPAISFLTAAMGATCGVVISASHNPPEFNGIKFFDRKGMKLPDELEDEIETQLEAEEVPMVDELGVNTPGILEARERYLGHLVGAAETSLEGMTVVVDCANGAASVTAPELLRRLGATVHAINATPDGANINDGCGALYPEVVAAEVVRIGADAGVSHDGDADRALFADAQGNVIDGDQVLAACAVWLRDRGRLPGDTVVTTVMANLGFHQAMEAHGIRVLSTKVGDRYVAEEMVRSGATLGGEQSGHLIFRDQAATGDGLLTAVRFLSAAAQQGRSIGELASVMRRFPQTMINVPISDRGALATAAAVHEAIRDAEAALGDRGRVLVRPSGTEPLVRVMVEAEDEARAADHAETIASVVATTLG